MAPITVSFTLDDEVDRVLLDWLARQPRRQKSVAIREALHSYLSSQGATLSEIYTAVRDVERMLDSKAVFLGVSGGEKPIGSDEPPEAVAALENLGLWS